MILKSHPVKFATAQVAFPVHLADRVQAEGIGNQPNADPSELYPLLTNDIDLRIPAALAREMPQTEWVVFLVIINGLPQFGCEKPGCIFVQGPIHPSKLIRSAKLTESLNRNIRGFLVNT